MPSFFISSVGYQLPRLFYLLLLAADKENRYVSKRPLLPEPNRDGASPRGHAVEIDHEEIGRIPAVDSHTRHTLALMDGGFMARAAQKPHPLSGLFYVTVK